MAALLIDSPQREHFPIDCSFAIIYPPLTIIRALDNCSHALLFISILCDTQ